jgi:cytidylate kinase
VIALDGPSGSGKSSVARALARAGGLACLDTGAMYRAVALWAMEQDTNLSDAALVADLAAHLPLAIPLDPDDQRFELAGRDVTEAIRSEAVSAQVSRVATNLAVREALVRWQRAIIEAECTPSGWSHGRGIVAEGRDITTVVAPDANVRVLLTASPQARLRRRALDNLGVADQAAIAATQDQVLRRDRDDSTVAAFESPAPGVTLIDSSDMDLEETVNAIGGLIGRP